MESRRGRASTGDGGTDGPRDGGLSPLGLAIVLGFSHSGGRQFATRPGSRNQSACFGDRKHGRSKEEFWRQTKARMGIPRFEVGVEVEVKIEADSRVLIVVWCWFEAAALGAISLGEGTAKTRRRVQASRRNPTAPNTSQKPMRRVIGRGLWKP